MRKSKNSNHPAKGASIKVEPIRTLEDIERIKTMLQGQPRNLCLFTLGINTAYRAGELLSLRIADVIDLRPGAVLDLKQSKNKEYRQTVMNKTVYHAIQNWLQQHPKQNDLNAPLFLSQRKNKSLTVAAVNLLMKSWCYEIGLIGNYGSHSLRKTWGYHQRVTQGQSLTLISRALGHATEADTLRYLGLLPDEVGALYLNMEL
ncbi:tyrosine-type recombinase/integrase [Agarilytica rhodophyticola]|uniref:tyrosine-type recombinase/integrase n=1 Tax=Agarilytica rhodophyticola TaxID=1737490 RepID=UPI000B345C8B|nr:tyrosine-type recombinase/integrase [Agarilytica rhodophyticola]